MAPASLELQGAIVSALKSAPLVAALVGQKIYDMAPADAKTPYVVIGDFDEHRADTTCVRSQKTYVTLHVWSAALSGFREVRQVADAVSETLHEAPLALPTNKLVSIDHIRTRVMRDLDGEHSHAVIELVAYTEKA